MFYITKVGNIFVNQATIVKKSDIFMTYLAQPFKIGNRISHQKIIY